MSIVQGLVITAGVLFVYQFAVARQSEASTRTMIFTALIMANIVLTLVNRSFYYSILTTLRYKNNSVAFIILLTLGLLGVLLYVKPFTEFFNFETLTAMQLLLCCVVGGVSVIWFEVVKVLRRRMWIDRRVFNHRLQKVQRPNNPAFQLPCVLPLLDCPQSH
jgi:Ca2+-transporting ATPase